MQTPTARYRAADLKMQAGSSRAAAEWLLSALLRAAGEGGGAIACAELKSMSGYSLPAEDNRAITMLQQQW